MRNRGKLLAKLSQKLVKVTYNGKIHRKLSSGGYDKIFNVFDEASQFVLDDLIEGKKLKIVGIRENDEDYFNDEETPKFKKRVKELVDERADDGLPTKKENLREIKNQVREEMSLPSLSELVPARNVDLIYGDRENVQRERHVDEKLQTDIDIEFSTKILKKINAERISILRERGLETLFISFGFLEWIRQDYKGRGVSKNSPICLMQVILEEDSKEGGYFLTSNGELVENEDLVEALKVETGNEPPRFEDFAINNEDNSVFHLEEYHNALVEFSKRYDGWKVRNRIAVGIFKSTGINRSELEPSNYSDSKIERVEKLLVGSGFSAEPRGPINVDKLIHRERIPAFVMPVDSSQHAAIIEASEGRDMVIEGPPGTGKSQTIVNLIATSIFQGKSVLFLAQKQSALDIVYERLKDLGIDNKCIPFYADNATKSKLYGPSGQIKKKIYPSEKNFNEKDEFDVTCKSRDDCLIELNDFSSLMLKEIYGETYQNIITTCKVYEKNIGEEPAPDFKLRDNFNFKNDGLDLRRIKQIDQTFSELTLSSRSLIELVRCKYTEPFKVEKMIKRADSFLTKVTPFLENYGSYSTTTCEDTLENLKYAFEKRLQMEQEFKKLSNDFINKLRNDGSLFDQTIKVACLSKSELNNFDTVNSQKTIELTLQGLKSTLDKRILLEKHIDWCTSSISKIKEELPKCELQIYRSNKESYTELVYPQEMAFFDKKLANLDIEKLRDCIVQVKKSNQNKDKLRKICFSITSSTELLTFYNILSSKRFSRIRCYFPFSKANKARKSLNSLFKEKVPFTKLRQFTDDLILLTKTTEEIDLKLSRKGFLKTTEKLEDVIQILEHLVEKISISEDLIIELASSYYLNDSCDDIRNELEIIELIGIKNLKIHAIKSEFAGNNLGLNDSGFFKNYIDIFSNLKNLLNEGVKVAEDIECTGIPKDVRKLYDLISCIKASQYSLSKIFSINLKIDEIEKSKGIGDWVRILLAKNISVEEKYLAHLYRYVILKISADDREIFQYNQSHAQNLKSKFAELEKKSRDELCKRIRSIQPSRDQIPTNHSSVIAERRGASLLSHVSNGMRRITIREFCHRASDALQHYCPCFMMTPQMVATLLPHDTNFDLLIIDEASQMLPEEAIGSILRSDQVIVVGDPKQMPPSQALISSVNDGGDRDNQLEDEMDRQKSILDLAVEAFRDYRRLRYHYRSEDENLIRFSNHEFYNEDLITIPNQHQNPELGVKYFFADGVYNPGTKTRSRNPNPIEADKTVDLIIKESREHPNWSLGVAVMNREQATRIEDILRERTENDRAFQDFESKWKESSQYFFIKNLENVQGDERDTMIIATVYGRDKDGRAQNYFGPINQSLGENRINVLVTRAKKRIVVCSSIRPNDITSARTGAQVFRKYLQYAITGKLEGTETTHVDDDDHYYDAPWEKWFHDRLEADGFIVDPQVGVSSWRIDLGVKHHDYPAGYICGIELDGPDHLRLSARDRDIERQSILESKGWTIFRVWSMDFFNDMEGEYQIIKKAVEGALIEKVASLGVNRP